MKNNVRLTSLAAAAWIAGSITTSCLAQNKDSSAPGAELTPIPRIDSYSLRLQSAPSAVGLKPKYGVVNEGVDLPFGMNYNPGNKSLLMPIDTKNEWGIGLNLNLNGMRELDATPSSGLGLQPKRTPGVMLQKKF